MKQNLLQLLKERHGQTIFAVLGIVVEQVDGHQSVVSIEVDHRHLQHLGMVHGGVFLLLHETVASLSAASAIDMTKEVVVAQSVDASHIRSVSSGKITAKSTSIHFGRTTSVYQSKIFNENDQLLSVGRINLVNIQSPSQTLA